MMQRISVHALLALVFFSAGFAMGAGLCSPTSLNEVSRLIRRGEHTLALERIKVLEPVGPSVAPYVELTRLRLLHRVGRDGEAICALRSLAGGDLHKPARAGATRLLARILMAEGKPGEAVPLLRSFLGALPRHRKALQLRLLLGQALDRTGRRAEAIEAFLPLAERWRQCKYVRNAFQTLYRWFVHDSFPRDLNPSLRLSQGQT